MKSVPEQLVYVFLAVLVWFGISSASPKLAGLILLLFVLAAMLKFGQELAKVG